MGIPIGRFRREVSSKDFTLYQAYDRIDPSSRQRVDFHAAMICNTLAKLHGHKRSKISDFMVDYDKPEKVRKTPAMMLNIFKSVTRASGGKVVG